METKKGFTKPPVVKSKKELEKLEQKFLQGWNSEGEEDTEETLTEIKTKAIIIRAPVSYHKNLLKIRQVTGMTINGVCLELLWPAIKQKLKDLGID